MNSLDIAFNITSGYSNISYKIIIRLRSYRDVRKCMEDIAWNIILCMYHLYSPVDVALVDLPEWVLPLLLRHWLVEGYNVKLHAL